MKRWTIAHALLSSTWRIRQLTPVLSVPLLEHRLSPFDMNGVGQRRQVSVQTTTTPFRLRFWWSNGRDSTNTRTFVTLRGGSDRKMTDSLHHKQDQEYTVLSAPAPGSPFHHAFPVHDLGLAKEFYGTVLGCAEGRSSAKWQDYSLHGHQIVAHWVGENYRCQDYYNPVDGDEVPVPHTGLALTVDQFHELANRLRKAGVQFIIEPHLRFKGMPGEQYTMFFKDPSGNNLEFKAMTNPQNLFAKYNVADN